MVDDVQEYRCGQATQRGCIIKSFPGLAQLAIVPPVAVRCLFHGNAVYCSSVAEVLFTDAKLDSCFSVEQRRNPELHIRRIT